MIYRKLGRTGVETSALCLGTMMFGQKADQAASDAMLKTFVEAGGNFVDTANVYGRGASETVLGQAIDNLGLDRDELVIATKCHGRMKDGDHQPNRFGNHRRMIVEECENSLRRLQIDYIDLYQIHRPQSDVPIDETLRAMDDLVRSGKVRYLGTSTFAAWQCVESLWVSEKLHLNRFVCEQPPYHLLDRRIERELIPMARTYGYGLIPWSPLAAGFLTGKYKRGQTPPGDARLQGDHHRAGMLSHDRAYDMVEAVEKIAGEKGCSVAQFALAWCMHQPGITSPIVGPRTVEQLVDNLGALDVELTDADREAVDAICEPGRAIVPFYKADFGPHKHRV